MGLRGAIFGRRGSSALASSRADRDTVGLGEEEEEGGGRARRGAEETATAGIDK